MKKIKVIFICLLFGHFLNAQTVYGTSLDSVKAWVEASPEFFENLGVRMRSRDSIVKDDEYVLLYYGSAYMDGYSPYGEKSAKRLIQELLDKGDIKGAIKEGEKLTKESPAFCGAYLYTGIAHEENGDSITARFYYDRYVNLISVPFYSGNGESPESAYVVRNIDDEYLILGELDYNFHEQNLVRENGYPFDVITVSRDSNYKSAKEVKQLEVYFNIHQPFVLGLQAMFGEEVMEGKSKKKKKKKKKKRKKG